ncbi:MAG TPA: hypothetical protein VF486_06270 [Actinomycetes bacterium]
MRTDDGKRPYVLVLVIAAVTVVLVAVLAAWTAWLGGGAWPPVLAPFAAVLAAPLAVLAWLLAAEGSGDWSQLPSGTEDQVAPHVGRAAA